MPRERDPIDARCLFTKKVPQWDGACPPVKCDNCPWAEPEVPRAPTPRT